MSNAMRLGKRTLAGVAATGLAAALIPFTGVGVSQAATATGIAFDVPSYTIVTDDWADASQIPIPLEATDVNGTAITGEDIGGATRAIRLTVTAPATALDDTGIFIGGNAAVVDDSGILLNVEGTATGTSLGTLTAFVAAANGSPANWSTINAANEIGTYTITAQLYNPGSGAIISTATMTIQAVTRAAAPAPTATFWNATGAGGVGNPINRVGVTQDDSLQLAKPAFVQLSNASGGPWLAKLEAAADTKLSVQLPVSGATATAMTPLIDDPWTPATASATPGDQLLRYTGIYNVGVAGVQPAGAWGTGATGSVTAEVRRGDGTTTPISSTLIPVEIGSLKAAGGMELLTTPNSVDADSDDTVYVPVGTTSLQFGVQYGLAAGGTFKWNAQSSRTESALGALAPSGGVVALNGAGQGTFSLAVNSQATRAGDQVIVRIQGQTFNVVFANAGVVLDAVGGLAKVSAVAPVAGEVVNRFGGDLTGNWVTQLRPEGQACTSTASPLATAAVAADGSFALEVPAAQALTSPGTKNFGVCAFNGIQVLSATAVAVTVTYTATGQVNSLTINSTAPGAGLAVVSTPARGIVNLADGSTLNAAASAAAADPNLAGTTNLFQITPVAIPAVPVEISVSEGAYLSSRAAGSFAWNLGVTEAVASSVNPTWVVYATKPGLHTITATVGETTQTLQFVAGVALGSGRTITISPATLEVSTQQAFPMEVAITDIYGNPVPDDTFIARGQGAVNDPFAIFSLNSNGTGTVLYTAGLIEGAGVASVTIGEPVVNPVAGSPAAVTTAQSLVTVKKGASEKSIVITGTRTTVNGRPGIVIDGITTGIENGKTVIPYFRFPGQTEYTQGSARPVVNDDEFTWQRRTGKKFYAYVTNDDGAVKSNRVIIPAK